MGNGCNFRVITMRGRGISFHGPVNSGEAGGHGSKPKTVLALYAVLHIEWMVNGYLSSRLHHIFNQP